MHNSHIDIIKSLKDTEQPYATAIIVRRKKPSSGKPGDKAIITQDGQIHGWIGGGCTQGIVLKEALLSLQDRKPRLVSISPDKKMDAFDNTRDCSIRDLHIGQDIFQGTVHPIYDFSKRVPVWWGLKSIDIERYTLAVKLVIILIERDTSTAHISRQVINVYMEHIIPLQGAIVTTMVCIFGPSIINHAVQPACDRVEEPYP